MQTFLTCSILTQILTVVLHNRACSILQKVGGSECYQAGTSTRTWEIVFYDTNKIRRISIQNFTKQYSFALRSSRLEILNADAGTNALQSQLMRQVTTSRLCHSAV